MSKNQQLQQRKDAVFARGMGNLAAIYVDHAKNNEIWDVEGRRYIDFAAGIAVVNTGHSHPRIQAAVADQLSRFSHTCVMVTPYESAVELAEKLVELTPGETPKKAIFVTTGAEAVENAVKIARAHTRRSGVIAFNGGFHGRTNMTMGLTGKVAPYKAGFGPFPSEIYHLPYPNEYHGVTAEQSLKALDELFHCDIEPGRVAALIIEPVQGEGGFYQAPPAFLQQLRAICDQHGIVLICDEIQTGFARTGKLFATEYSGIEPDLMTMAKGIAGGFPLSAVVGKADIMDAANPGGLGGTYAAFPLACAAGLEVLNIIEEEQLCDKALVLGELMNKRLSKLQAKYPHHIGQVRNLGAMAAMELVHNGDVEQPNAELTKAIVAKGIEKGVLMLSCGVRGNVIRFLPPLTSPLEVVGEGLDLLEQVLAELI